MSEPMTTVHLKRCLSFPLSDPSWRQRWVIGSALLLAGIVVPIVPTLFVAGYLVRVMCLAIAGEEPSLPAWDRWEVLGVDGFRSVLVALVFFLPVDEEGLEDR